MNKKHLTISIISITLLLLSGIVKGVIKWRTEKVRQEYSEQKKMITDVAVFKKNKQKILSIKKEIYDKKNTSPFITDLIRLINESKIALLSVKPGEEQKDKNTI